MAVKEEMHLYSKGMFGIFITLFIPISSLSVNIGIICDTSPNSWQYLFKVASAITIAKDKLIEDGIIQKDTINSIIWRDTILQSDGPGNVVDLVINENVDVIFGSPSSRVTVAAGHLTSHFNIPQITWSGNSYELADKTLFRTLVRTFGPLSESGPMLVTLFKKFNWEKIGLLYEDYAVCLYSATGLKDAFAINQLAIMQSIAFPRNTVLLDDVIDDYLRLIKQTSRIIFLCVDNIRPFLIRACKLNMCNGDYVFLYTTTAMPDDTPWYEGDVNDVLVKQAYSNLIQVVSAEWNGDDGKERLDRFGIEVIDRMSEPPWNSTYAKINNMTTGSSAQRLYNAMYLYGMWLNHSTINNVDYKNGTAWLQFAKNKSFEGISGPCDIGSNGDGVPYFWLYQFLGDDVRAQIVAVSEKKNTKITEYYGFRWDTPDGNPPLDTPICGFFNEFCPVVDDGNETVVIAVSLSVLVILTTVVMVGFLIRKRKLENELLQGVWKVKVDELELHKPKGPRSRMNMTSQSALSFTSSQTEGGGEKEQQMFMTSIAILKGQMVSMRIVNRGIVLAADDLQSLKSMREMMHDNINPFIGACFDTLSPFVLFQYCPKGSLQDVLENDDIQLDLNFKNSLAMDLVQGMNYIHTSKLNSHGRLKSSNCLVDNRWMLKVSDYGLGRFLGDNNVTSNDAEEHEKYKSMLWTAPELLASPIHIHRGTREGDVYSFGIILHEIYFRMGPFSGVFDLTAKDIIGRVKSRVTTPCRPAIFTDVTDVIPEVIKLMQNCWNDNETERPTISVIRSYMRKNIQHGKSVNIVDVILERLEKYATNLEGLVDQRTQQLMLEKQKSDKLLYRMLPQICAEKLKAGEHVKPEVFEAATVFFSDIVGFTSISSKSTPMQVVDLLNDLYTCFDDIIIKYDAYKVETIGDAYLVVSGIPNRNGDLHAGFIADMSLDIVEEVSRFKIKHLPLEVVRVRIGCHTGSCCAGIVGLSMPRYCLFGDTVNTASRMESNGEAQKVHLSESTHMALERLGGYKTIFRAELEIKGKGLMRTYWLVGGVETPDDQPDHSQLGSQTRTTPKLPIPDSLC